MEARLAHRLILLSAAFVASPTGVQATSSVYTVTTTGSGGSCTAGATDDASSCASATRNQTRQAMVVSGGET